MNSGPGRISEEIRSLPRVYQHFGIPRLGCSYSAGCFPRSRFHFNIDLLSRIERNCCCIGDVFLVGGGACRSRSLIPKIYSICGVVLSIRHAVFQLDIFIYICDMVTRVMVGWPDPRIRSPEVRPGYLSTSY